HTRPAHALFAIRKKACGLVRSVRSNAGGSDSASTGSQSASTATVAPRLGTTVPSDGPAVSAKATLTPTSTRRTRFESIRRMRHARPGRLLFFVRVSARHGHADLEGAGEPCTE